MVKRVGWAAMCLLVMGCTGGSGGGSAGFPSSGPVQSGGAEGAPCTPGFHTVGCLVGGNARMECDGASSKWKLVEQCAAGMTCVETIDRAGTRSTACQAQVQDAGGSSGGTSSGGTSGSTSGGTSGGSSSGGADAGSTSNDVSTTSSSSGGGDAVLTVPDTGGSSGGTTSSSSGTTSSSGSSGTTSSSGAQDAGSSSGSSGASGSSGTTSSSGSTADAGSSSGSSGSSSSSGADAGPSTEPANIPPPNITQTGTPNVSPESISCPTDGTKKTSSAGNVTCEYHVKTIGGVEKLHGELLWKAGATTIRKLCINENKLVGTHESWDSSNSTKTYEAHYNSKGQLHGPSNGWHANGQKSWTGMYKDGERVGFFEVWNDQGIKTARAWHDSNGKLAGKYEAWHDNGQQEGVEYYKGGEPHGVLKGFHDTGSKSYTGAYKDGLHEGNHAWWSKSQQLLGVTTYKGGNGKLKIHHDNGKVAVEGTYVGGKRHGKWTWYFDSGAKNQEVEFTLGSGQGTAWHSNGQKAVQLVLKDGIRHGYWKFWDSQGQLEQEGEYNEGDRVKTWVYYNAGQEAYKLCFIDGSATVTGACESSWLLK